ELYPDINIIDMTKETYFCSEEHKWGLSPYHFEKKYYLNFIRILDQITRQWTPNYKRHKTNFGDVNIMLEYDSSLTYLDFTTSSNIVESKTLKFDREGIPLIKLGSNGQYGFQYYPITIAIYGLECISKYYKTGIDSYRKSFIKICEYFVEKQESNGIWYSEFDYHYGVRECGSCKAPWASALAQGFAISCLVRAYYLTKNTNYISSAKKAISCFFIDIEKGGVRRILFNEYIFFEEYPTEKPSHILNGFMFSLLSLYELYITTKEKEICELYKQGIHTLIQTVSMYDLGNVSSYDLTHITIPGNPSKYHYQYHLTHVHLLSAINLIEQNSILEKVLHRWLTYAQGNKSCFRLEENNIKIIINEVEENKLMFKNQENSVRIEYDLNEELDYAFYINNDDKRILTKKYDKNNSIKFTPIENNYTIIAFVKDKFDNKIAKSF
ncbi:D-glucuronyl C5-epimerase family protein, partial [Priestia megaterium]